MQILHISATLKFDKELLRKIKIPRQFKVVTTIQYLKQVKACFPDSSQILGCSKLTPAENYLYIGTGHFHPLRLIRFAKNIYILNPETRQFYKLEQDEIETCKKQLKGKQLKFLTAKNPGILVSVKSGQYNMKQALKLSKRLNAKIFLFNTLQKNELENFPQIDCWINASCPRIEGKNIINLEDLPNL